MNEIPKGEAPAPGHELRKMESQRRNWAIDKKRDEETPCRKSVLREAVNVYSRVW